MGASQLPIFRALTSVETAGTTPSVTPGTPTTPHQVPLDVSICLKSDAGAPVVASDAAGPCAQAYVDIARRLQAKLQALSAAADGRPASASVRIVVER